MNSAIQQAAMAIKAGDRQKAYQLLVQVIEADPRGKDGERAWILLSYVVKDPIRKRQCLETALAINPNNQKTRQLLAQLDLPIELDQPVHAVQQSPAPETNIPMETNGPQIENIMSQQEHSEMLRPANILSVALDPLLLTGLLGLFLLMIGVFTPIVSVPITGNLNYFQNGTGAYVLILSVISLIPLFMRRYQWLWITGLLILSLIGATLLHLTWVIAEMRRMLVDEASDTLLSGLAELLTAAVQIQWGWVVLFSGVALVIITAIGGRKGPWPYKHITVGLLTAIALFILVAGTRIMGEAGGLTANLGNRLGANHIPVGEPVPYSAGTLRILQVHYPSAFHIVESTALGHKGVGPIPGVVYVSVEMEFTCTSMTEVVCDTVPEASLELELEDGRRVDDDWSLYDAPRLGGEAAAGGGSATGWRVFRVPEGVQLRYLIVNPYGDDTSYQVELPEPINGYTVSHPWVEIDNGRVQFIPALRQHLQEQGIVAAMVIRLESTSGGSSSATNKSLALELCTDVSFFLDESEVLDEHETLILNTLREAINYHQRGELLLLRISDCSFLPSEAVVGFSNTDINRWRQGAITDAELLRHAIVSLD